MLHWPLSRKASIARELRAYASQMLTRVRLISDKTRIQKGLYTAFGSGVPVTLKQTSNGFNEAEYIADEIKRLIAHTGNLLTLDDFAIFRKFIRLAMTAESLIWCNFHSTIQRPLPNTGNYLAKA